MRALVTGGHRGLGLQITRTLVNHHYDVVAVGRSVQNHGERIAKNGAFEGTVYKTDIREPFYVNQLFANHGPFDVVVNNANIIYFSAFDGDPELKPTDMLDMIRTNIFGHQLVIKTAWKQMTKMKRGGMFVNISSMGAVDPLPDLSVYGATKAWLECYSKAMTKAGQDIGIKTVVIRLGAVNTKTLLNLYPNFDPDKALSPKYVAEQIFEAIRKQQNGMIYQIAAPNQEKGFE